MLRWWNFSETQQVALIVDDREFARTPRGVGELVAELEHIRAKAGIFYTGIIPGCSCANDPTPETEYSEYCEVLFDINKRTAETLVTLLAN